MSEADIIGTKSTRISSDEILQRAFPTKVRGISESEVRSFLRRIAEDFEKLETREEQLLEQIRQLEHSLENRPKVTKHELLESLGEETARVLTNAEEAAEKMITEAKEASEKMLKDAQEKSDLILTTAQQDSDEKMENVHARIRSLHQSAERDVETLIDEARTLGREIFQDAVIVREKILKDLLRRRDLLLEQIDELRKGREELLESYKIVKGSFQKATDSLHAVEEKASTELMTQQIDVDELLKSPVELPQTLEKDHKLPSQEIDLTDDNLDLNEAENAVQANEIPNDEKVMASVGAQQNAAQVSSVGVADKKRGIKGYMKDALGVSDEPKPQVINPDEVKNDISEDSIAIKIVETPAEKEEQKNDTEQQKPLEAKKDVGELFKTLKEQKEPKSVDKEDNKNNEEIQDAAAKIDEKPKKAKKKKATAIEKRNELFEEITPAILKLAKKQLQDEQNELLDNLRTVKTKKIEAQAVLPDENTQIKIWQEALHDDLNEIFTSGAKSVSNKKPKYSQEALHEAISWIITPLRESLKLAIEEGDQAEASARVGAKYREWRNTELKTSLYDAMSSAYNNGVIASADKDATLKWEVEKQGRCPDCDDNALEPTSLGENFPTGQIAPPAHSGCKCVLVVA